MKNAKLRTGAKIRNHPWDPEEEEFIHSQIYIHGSIWAQIALQLNTTFHNGAKIRSPRQVREHWLNFLNPELSKAPWTDEEEQILIEQQSIYGNKWAKIASKIHSRNENQVKNHWISINRQKRADEIKKKADVEKVKANMNTSEETDLSPEDQDDLDWHIEKSHESPDVSEYFDWDNPPLEDFIAMIE